MSLRDFEKYDTVINHILKGNEVYLKIFRKGDLKMKRRTLTIAICFLALVAIISVGFASWIITRPVQDATTAGSISTETVVDNSYTLTAEAVSGSSGVIQYGKPADYTPEATDWLSNDGAVENLAYEIKLTANYYEHMAAQVYFNIYLKESTVAGWAEINSGYLYQTPEQIEASAEKTASKFATVKASNYIAAPTLGINGKDAVNYSANYVLDKDEVFGCVITYTNVESQQVSEFKTAKEIKELAAAGKIVVDGEGKATTDAATVVVSGTTATISGAVYCKVKINFGWGTAFNSKNPLVYYNALDVNANWEAAKAALEAINTIGEATTTYKVVVSDKVKAANLAA